MHSKRTESVAWVSLVAAAALAAGSLVVDLLPVLGIPGILVVASVVLGMRHAFRLGPPPGTYGAGIAVPPRLLLNLGRARITAIAATGVVALSCLVLGGGPGTDVVRVNGRPELDIHGSGPVISEARYRREQEKKPRAWAAIFWAASSFALVLLAQDEWPERKERSAYTDE
jgi:hypothetical protein